MRGGHLRGDSRSSLRVDDSDDEAVRDAEEVELVDDDDDEHAQGPTDADGAEGESAQTFELSVSVHGKGRRVFKLPLSVTAHGGSDDSDMLGTAARTFCEESLADLPPTTNQHLSGAMAAKLLACERDLVLLVKARLRAKFGRGEGQRRTDRKSAGRAASTRTPGDIALQAMPALQHCARIRLEGQLSGSPQSGRMGSYTRLSQTAHGAPVFMLDHRTDTFLHFFQVGPPACAASSTHRARTCCSYLHRF